MLKETVIFLVKQLVARPDMVEIQEVDDEKGKALKLVVDKDDIGKVIGKDGQTIKAIRSMVVLFKSDQDPFVGVVIDS